LSQAVRRAASILLVVALVGFLLPSVAQRDFSAATAAAKEAPGEAPSWIDPEPFQYDPRNKPNPFQPFLRQAPSSEEEEAENRASLSPLERISPSQLHLKGILSSGSSISATALVELPNGKAYLLRKGTRIGTEGARVESIKRDRVIIREYFIDVMGEKKSKQTVLKLPQGEENE